MNEYNGPVGKAAVLESFRDYTEPFMVYDLADEDLFDKVTEFMETQRSLNPNLNFINRSGGTFEGMLPYFNNKLGCYVGRTFAGLMDSDENFSFRDRDDLERMLFHQSMSFFEAGGGNKRQRDVYMKLKDKHYSEQMFGSDSSIFGSGLKQYADSRDVDLSKHEMKFILQNKIEKWRKITHFMEHPNSPNHFLYGDVKNMQTNLMDYESLYSRDGRYESPLGYLNYVYDRIVPNLNPDFTYLMEFVLNDDSGDYKPVQATPIFRKNPIKDFKPSFRGDVNVILADFDDSEIFKLDRYHDLMHEYIDCSGKVVVGLFGNFLKHLMIRSVEGSKALFTYYDLKND